MSTKSNDNIIVLVVVCFLLSAIYVMIQLDRVKETIKEPKPQRIEYLIKRNLKTVCLEGVRYWVKYPFGNYGFLAPKYDTITGEVERCEY